MTNITISAQDRSPRGSIIDFNVTAECPNCKNDTDVDQYELKHNSVQCMHCDQNFQVHLD